MFKNATSMLKNDAYEVALGQEASANIIACYQKEDIGTFYEAKKIESVVKRVQEIELKVVENTNQPHCQNPKCSRVADTKLNGKVNLCFKCVDLLREWKSNYELGTKFNSKEKLLKLFCVIEELSPQKRETKEMVRCANIYCGTLDNITKHHLIPKPFRNGETVPKIPLCEPCHKRVHKLATNQELAEQYFTKQSVVELLINGWLPEDKDKPPFRVRRFLEVFEKECKLVTA